MRNARKRPFVSMIAMPIPPRRERSAPASAREPLKSESRNEGAIRYPLLGSQAFGVPLRVPASDGA